jgi:hypothetical protein
VTLALPDRSDLLASLGLLAFVLSFFRRAVFGGQVLFERDIALVWYPQVSSFLKSVGAGSWPLWDPYRGFGQPLLADPNAMLLYPFTWLNLVIPPGAFHTLFVVFHVGASAWGTYALLRRWDVSRAGAFVGAAVWAANGPFLSLGSLWIHLAGAAWMPWVFLAAEDAITRRTAGRTLRFGLVVAGQLLAGSADMAAFTHLALGTYVLARHVQWRDLKGRDNRALLGTWAIALFFGIGLACAQWIPTLGMVMGSVRSDLPRWHRTAWSLHPLGLAEMFFPVLWAQLPQVIPGIQDTLDLQVTFLHSVYLGVPALALGAAGALARHSGRTFFLLAAAALLYALGRHTVFYDVVAFLIPLLRVLRYPVKAMIVVAFAWSLLVGLGYDVWRRAPSEGRRFTFLVLGPSLVLALACLGAALACTLGATTWGPLMFNRKPEHPSYAEILAPLGDNLVIATILAALLAAATVAAGRWRGVPGQPATFAGALALASLAFHHASLNPTCPSELYTIRPDVLDILRRESATPRLYVYDYTDEGRKAAEGLANRKVGYVVKRVPVGWTDKAALYLGFYLYMQPPTAGRFGLYGSYDLDLLGLHPQAMSDMIEYLHSEEKSPLHLRLLQMGSVDYVLGLFPEPWWTDLTDVASIPGIFKEPIRVFKVPRPLARSYVVAGTRIARGPGPRAAISAISAEDFDPRREVVLDAGEGRPAPEGFVGRSRIEESRPDRVRVVVEASHPGYAVLVDAYNQGWRATVDGTPVPVERANVCFRAVPVPAGQHVVEYTYRPRSVALGLAVAASTALLGLAWMWLPRHRAEVRSQ